DGRRDEQATGPTRALVVADSHEPVDLAPKILALGGAIRTKRLFNAAVALLDDTGNARPYLAEKLPELHTDSWRVFPDGRMETTYQVRDHLTWQDGHTLDSEDFAFAYRVYATGVGPFLST